MTVFAYPAPSPLPTRPQPTSSSVKKAARKEAKRLRLARLLGEYGRAVRLETLQDLHEEALEKVDAARTALDARVQAAGELENALDSYAKHFPNTRPKECIIKDVLGGKL